MQAPTGLGKQPFNFNEAKEATYVERMTAPRHQATLETQVWFQVC